MKHNVEAFKKYYINATKEEVIEDMFLDNCNLQQEIERLHSIINEFMEELKWQRKVSLSLNEAFAVSRIDTLINKLQELKGSDKDE